MAILDTKGRLFGKINLLDLGAALVILLVIVGIFIFPGTSGSVAQVGAKTVPIEVDLLVRGLNVRNPEQLFKQGLKQGGKTNVIIRNQPYGQIGIKSIQLLGRMVTATQPDGSVKELPDPRSNNFSTDFILLINYTQSCSICIAIVMYILQMHIFCILIDFDFFSCCQKLSYAFV